MSEHTASKDARPNERRALLVRAAAATAIVAVMLGGLSLWDRSRPRKEETVSMATPPVPAPSIHAIGSDSSAPAVEPETVESAPVAVRSVPEAGDVVEETRGVETPPQQGKVVEAAPVEAPATPAPRRAASAPVARVEPAHAEAQPRLILQTETAPPGSRPPAGKAFALQVGVFSNAANAEDLRAKLVLAGVPAQIETRVEVGPFKSREEAAAAQAKLNALGMERGKLVLVKP